METIIHFIRAAALGLIEGLTEFIPVSSTGHLILVGDLIDFSGPVANTFRVFIQPGAILAAVFLYKDRFIQLVHFQSKSGFAGINGCLLLGISTAPALLSGALAHSFIKQHLFTPLTVAIGLGVGGIGMLLVERFISPGEKSNLDDFTWREALTVGLFQCLALWPGMSRSASTMIGGMVSGVDRKTAAEYSFLVAVPVLFAASIYDLYKSLHLLHVSDIPIFITGFISSFIFASLAIQFVIRFLKSHTLRPFAWYRIVLSVILLMILR